MDGLISQQDYRLIAVMTAYVSGIALFVAASFWFLFTKSYNPREVMVLRIPLWLTVAASLFGVANPFFHQFGVIGGSKDLSMAVSGSLANVFTIWIISIAVWRCGWNRRAFAMSMSGITLLMLPIAIIDTVTELKIGTNGMTHIVLQPVFFLGACFIYQSFKARTRPVLGPILSDEIHDGY